MVPGAPECGGGVMVADPELVAIRTKAIQAMNPPERIARELRIDQSHHDDGYIRAEMIRGELSPDVVPTQDAVSIALPNSPSDNLEALLAELDETITEITPYAVDTTSIDL